ncbi:MAG: hypothetical protein HQK97_01825 [Nitrospirae bacterium]|nr:hypothetical protein [Nitrospirota bacterium]
MIALEEGKPVAVNERTTDCGEVRYEELAHINGETIKVVYAKSGDDIRIISAHKNTSGNFDKHYEQIMQSLGTEKMTAFNQAFSDWKRHDIEQKKESKLDIAPMLAKQQKDRAAELSKLSGEATPEEK